MTGTDNSISQSHAGFHTPEEMTFALIKEHTGCAAILFLIDI